VKEQLYNYLRQRATGVTTQELVEQVLKVRSAPEEVSRKLLESIVGADSRFRRDAEGLWHVEPARPSLLEDTSLLLAEALALPPAGELVEMGLCQCKALRAQSTVTVVVRRSSRYRFEWAVEEAATARNEVKRLEDLVSNLWAVLQEARLVGFHPLPLVRWLNDAALRVSGDTLEIQPISLQKLARRLFEGRHFQSLEDIAAFLGMRYVERGRVVGRLELSLEVFGELLKELGARAVFTVTDLLEFLSEEEPVDFSRYAFDREFLRNLPQRPGVYLMKNHLGEILYVGKAKNLRTRVSSYFYHREPEEKKVRTLLETVYSIDLEVLGSELEALLLEQRYIARYQPPINRQLAVRPRAVRRFKEKNLIILQPSKVEQALEVFLVSRGGGFRQVRVGREGQGLPALRAACAQLFFGEHLEEPQEEGHTLLSRWLALNEDRVTWIDVDALGELDHCMAVLENYIADPATVLERVQRL